MSKFLRNIFFTINIFGPRVAGTFQGNTAKLTLKFGIRYPKSIEFPPLPENEKLVRQREPSVSPNAVIMQLQAIVIKINKENDTN